MFPPPGGGRGPPPMGMPPNPWAASGMPPPGMMPRPGPMPPHMQRPPMMMGAMRPGMQRPAAPPVRANHTHRPKAAHAVLISPTRCIFSLCLISTLGLLLCARSVHFTDGRSRGDSRGTEKGFSSHSNFSFIHSISTLRTGPRTFGRVAPPL